MVARQSRSTSSNRLQLGRTDSQIPLKKDRRVYTSGRRPYASLRPDVHMKLFPLFMKTFVLCIATGAAVAIWCSGVDPLRLFGFRRVYHLRELPLTANSSSSKKASSKRTRPRISPTNAPVEDTAKQPGPVGSPSVTGDQITPRTPEKSITELADESAASSSPDGQSAPANVGTCGEYRNGKLTVQPCSKISVSAGEWLEGGFGSDAARSDPVKSRH